MNDEMRYFVKRIEVVAAIIKIDKSVLCLQRNANKYNYISNKFEFPGGKIELNENHKQALQRELREEMTVEVSENQMSYFMTVEHTYPDFIIIMHTYLCEVINVSYSLNEHIDAKWCNSENINELDWAAADVPIVNKLLSERVI